MKSFFSLVFLFLFTHSAYAGNLCDTSCNLTITFPTGGSIVATETITFTFGTDGVLDLGATGTINTAVQPDSTDYSAGGTLTLAAGESISFDVGGSLDLGAGGAISHTNITVTTDGDFNLQVVSEAGSVYFGDITINGMGSLIISVTGVILEISPELGSLTVDGGGIIISADGFILSGSFGDPDSHITLIATGSITHSGGTITASSLSLTASSIGTDTDPIMGEVNTLSITTTGVGDAGNIYLNSTGTSSISCTTSTSSDVTIISGTYDPVTSSCNVLDAGVIATGGALTLSASDITSTSSYVAPVLITSNVIQNTSPTTDNSTLIISEPIPLTASSSITLDSQTVATGNITIVETVTEPVLINAGIDSSMAEPLTEITIDDVLYSKTSDGNYYTSPEGITGTIQLVEGEEVFVPNLSVSEVEPVDFGAGGSLNIVSLLLLFFNISLLRYGRKSFII